jgi:predicted secreted protein
MPIFTAIALYVVIWWTALFAVLPIGTRPVAEADETTGWRGLPENPRMGRKLLITTAVSAVVWAAIVLVIASGWLSFRTGWLALPQ